MRIDLPWPDKILWPNGPRARNHGHKASVAKKHHDWAYLASLEAMQDHCPDLRARPLPITIEVHAKPKGPLPDRDNCVAAAKHSLDGIAHAIGVNDREFATPQVVFSPERDGRFVVIIGGLSTPSDSSPDSSDVVENSEPVRCGKHLPGSDQST